MGKSARAMPIRPLTQKNAVETHIRSFMLRFVWPYSNPVAGSKSLNNIYHESNRMP